MIQGNCHCKNISWKVNTEIDRITSCNCTVCSRYGSLWAYGYKDKNITVIGTTTEYTRDEKSLGFHFCPHCGCVAYWLSRSPNAEGNYRIAVNVRLTNTPEKIESISIRHFDGLNKFRENPPDHRCVKDMWF